MTQAPKLSDQDLLLQAVARMAAGELNHPVRVTPGSGLTSLALGLERMRQDILRQLHELTERNAEVQQLNRELRYQIERRSGLLVESMLARGDSGPAEVVPTLAIGMLLAQRYRIEERLGQGAMGVVYGVERLADGRRFAAKILGVKPDYQTMARFAREAQLLARLQHPNLIAIVDADVTADRVAYIIMELAAKQSLAELSTRFGDCDFILPILYQIADALAAVHAAGVVHRDVKPGNVLISLNADGTRAQAKLADFGVSRLLGDSKLDGEARPVDEVALVTGAAADLAEEASRGDALMRQAAVTLPLAPALRFTPTESALPESRRQRISGELTEAGTLLGTLLYMAPELRDGANLAHPPADIFSFGVMTYEVLTGTLPFAEIPSPRNHGRGAMLGFTPLDCLCPSLPPALVRTFEACLAGDPSRRPTAVELVAALSQVLGSE